MRSGVLGFGISGQAAIEYFLSKGHAVCVFDDGKESCFGTEIVSRFRHLGVDFTFGNADYVGFESLSRLFVSPGVPLDSERVKTAQKIGVEIVGELSLLADEIDKPVIAVTGTNGKTTVTELIHQILQHAGFRTFLGGNIGRPVFEYIIGGEEADILVLEVSSFQLELAGNFAPRVGLLLNVTPDHLDRHGNMANYVTAKMNLFQQQKKGDYAVLGESCMQMLSSESKELKSRTIMFGGGDECEAKISGDQIVLNCFGESEKYNLSDTQLKGMTGCLNGAAALAAARCVGVKPPVIQKALEEFSSSPHRMEMVGVDADGVQYINDSKATNTGAVISAVSQVKNKAVLIAGGRDKGDDYSLLESVMDKVKLLILIGEAAEKIETALQGKVEIVHAQNMEEAVCTASNEAEAGETVLLAPACSSFDMFKSYGHRGEVFRECVQRVLAG